MASRIMTDVFISYSHQNIDFAKRLRDGLKGMEQDIWIDLEGIQFTADWWETIKKGIEAANNFVFVMSPISLASPVCMLEMAHARENGKRIVPLMYSVPDEKAAFALIWEESKKKDYDEMLAGRDLVTITRDNWGAFNRHQYVDFQDSKDFDVPLRNLISAIRTDLAHVNQHTRLLNRAREWQAKGDSADSLLRGHDLLEAENWLVFNREKNPPPIDLHERFIAASAAERARQEAEEQRIHEETIRLGAEAEFNKRLYDRVRQFILRFATSAAGFAAGLGGAMALLYIDPGGERAYQRISVALLSLGLSAYFGAVMVIVTEFLPLLRGQKRGRWRQPGLFALAWFICYTIIILMGYIYYGEPTLGWQPFSALLIVGGFTLPVYVTKQIGWRVAGGMVGTFAALFAPWLLDPRHAPIGFDVTSGDVSAPLCAWMALTFAVGTYLPEILRWLRSD
jgi:hypothetical protein